MGISLLDQATCNNTLSLSDIKAISLGQLGAALQALPRFDHEESWKDGTAFPWWILLGATYLRQVLNGGIIDVTAQVTNEDKSLRVESVDGISYLKYDPDEKTIRRTTQPSKC